MVNLKYIKRGACIGAAVLMLGACGQADKAPSETVAETTAAGTLEDAAESKEEESKETKEEETTKEESEEESSDKEESKEESDKEESKEESKKEESGEEEDASGEASKAEEVLKTEEAVTEAESEEAVTDAAAPAQGEAKSVQDIYGEIGQTVSLNAPMLVPEDYMANYGIDLSTLDEYVFSMSEAAISAETVVILKAKDAGSTGALSAALQTVIDQKRSEMENYLPDQFQIVDQSSVQVKGNYVYLVISEQADAINRIIQANLP